MNNRIAAACGAAVLLAGASACGSASKDNTSPTSGSTAGPQTSQQGTGRFPGASGKVADVNGSTAQVQSQQDGQVAVSWTGTTTFTQEVAASLADVKVGDCVMVTPTQADSTSSDDTEVAAGNVRITATTGTCTPRLRGPGGGPSFNGAPPSGAPTGAPPGGTSRGSFGAFGKVTAVSASGFTVSSVRPSAAGSSSTATTVTITTSRATTYTMTATAAASDVKVGRCLTAQGTTDSTGAVRARTIALSTAVDGQCGGGFFRSRSGTTGTGQES